MPTPITTTILPFVLALVAAMPAPATDLPTVRPYESFPIPLSDSTTGTAIYLPTSPTEGFLVYSTPTGLIGLWRITTTAPQPIPPTPIPPTPPTPPPELAYRYAIIDNPTAATPQQRDILSRTEWRNAIKPPNTFIGIFAADYRDPNTNTLPPPLQPFFTALATTTPPAIVILRSDGSTATVRQLPDSLPALLRIISNPEALPHGSTHHNPQRLAPTPP
jgi:hypothetical protein